MKKRLFIFVSLVGVSLFTYINLKTAPQKTMSLDNLPWQVEALTPTTSRVFGITLGETNLFQAMEVWGGQPKVGLFVSPDGTQRLEASFGKLRIGVFDAYVIARLAPTDAQLKHFFDVKLERSPMPSGDYKYELPEKELAEAHKLPMTELTYVPSVEYTDELVRQRFGAPQKIKPLAEGRGLWLYPDKNLALILDEEDKEILHYVNTQRFNELATQL